MNDTLIRRPSSIEILIVKFAEEAGWLTFIDGRIVSRFLAWTAEDMREEQRQSFGSEIWAAYRPYLLITLKDTLICGMLWVVLLFFNWLTKMLPIPGWEGRYLYHLHQLGVVTTLFMFVWLMVTDLFRRYAMNRKLRIFKKKEGSSIRAHLRTPGANKKRYASGLYTGLTAAVILGVIVAYSVLSWVDGLISALLVTSILLIKGMTDRFFTNKIDAPLE